MLYIYFWNIVIYLLQVVKTRGIFKWFGLGIIQVFFFVFPCQGSQPDFSFGHISLSQRLPGANVYCVYQDHKGLIWLAIESVGLCKFDGENFIIYSKSETDSNTISNNFPLCIVEDKSGALWVGTTEGLNKFDRKKGVFHRYLATNNTDNCIPNNYITDLLVDKHNNIWIATQKGLSKYTTCRNEFKNLLVGERDSNRGAPALISTLFEDEQGNIWIGSYSSGLFLVDNIANKRHTADRAYNLTITKHWFPVDQQEHNASHNYAVQQICQLGTNSLLLGKIDGLYQFDIKSGKFTKYDRTRGLSVENSTVSALFRDDSNKIWVGYATDGLLYINPATSEKYYFDADKYLPNGLRSNTIRNIFQDNSGLIWIATKFQGIHTYDNRQETFKRHEYNTILNGKIKNKFILSIFEDTKKNIWIGTKNSGLFQFNPTNNEIVNFSSEQANAAYYIVDDRVECIGEDSQGNIWAGTEHGLNRLDKSGDRFTPYNNYFIRCMVADKDGNLWIGTNTSGILYYNHKTDKTIRYESAGAWPVFSNNALGIRYMEITSDTILWVSSFQDGLYKYNIPGDILTHYTNNQKDFTSISGNMVRAIFKDSSGKIWIGTKSNGLNTYDRVRDNFDHVQEIQGLPPKTIYNILQDKNNNFWMGSHEGLFFFNPTTGLSVLYNMVYGLKNNVFETCAKCMTSSGLLIFGGSGGLNVFDPDMVCKNDYNAPLVITSVKAYDKIIAEDLDEYSEISVNYNEKYISIGFALADYSDPLSIKYKYMLKNFDRGWVECNNRNYATYTFLPPGDYIFRVMATNSVYEWNNSPLEIKIIIEAPFWRKPFFILGGIVFIILIIIFIIVARVRFIKKNEARLLELVDNKTRDLMELNLELEEHKAQLVEAKEKAEESDKLKTAFLANMSHEIRTPMNGIIGFTDLLKEPELAGDMQLEYIDVIQKSSSRMLRIINDLIDISKIEAGQITIIKEKVNIDAMLHELFIFFKPDADIKGIYFIHQKNTGQPDYFVNVDKARITQVFSNLINNALKFTTKGQITFGYTKKEKVYEFYVHDTGCGIPYEMKDTVFERFRQAGNSHEKYTEGSGLGLSISKAIVEMHGGKIWVVSVPDSGSIFYFTLPVDNSSGIDEVPIQESAVPKPVSLTGKKVLIAEDDEISFYYLSEYLSAKGLKVLRAKNGVEAVELVDMEADIDIILMDMKMPKMNGLEALKQIKRKHAHIPIIMQTAFAQVTDRQKYLAEGCDDYIAKPIHIDQLINKISKYLVTT
jgi:signal transduction histidine kinase/ligand-binding sensor domain-containing protein